MPSSLSGCSAVQYIQRSGERVLFFVISYLCLIERERTSLNLLQLSLSLSLQHLYSLNGHCVAAAHEWDLKRHETFAGN